MRSSFTTGCMYRSPRRWLALRRPPLGKSFSTSRWHGSTANTRNIGIIAHIDAGKTTTTERMLYYSGHTRMIGNVDEGSTVTDFLPAERARGITIQSAAITFHWPPLQDADGASRQSSTTVNLIDTPGHSDFTFEVIRSLRILDGAVCILDGVAGVEAQTEKVWLQAGSYGIPRIIFVNKLDRDGAAFGKSVKEVAEKLHAWPVVCQIPWFAQGDGPFQGVVDLIRLVGLHWAPSGDGKTIKIFSLEELEAAEPKLAEEARRAREALVESLCERDEVLIGEWERHGGDYNAIPAESILQSLRKCLLDPSENIVPIFAGASFRNIGVQPLLDAVVDLLPSPLETPDSQVEAGAYEGGLAELLRNDVGEVQGSNTGLANHHEDLEACALAFKVVNDVKKGVLVYVRVYHGNLKPGSSIFNTNLQITERVPRLLRMMASDSVEVDSIPAGQIGVITGLKKARTGDTLIGYKKMNAKKGPPAPFNNLQLRPIIIPPPVFFASVEPYSLGEEKPVKDALELLLREDPSLQLSVDEDSGQTHLSGMGELHLEIARDRLINDLKAKAHVGKIEIGYRERTTADATVDDFIFSKDLAGKPAKAGCSVTVRALESEESVTRQSSANHSTIESDGNCVEVKLSSSNNDEAGDIRLPTHLLPEEVHRAIQNGVLSGLGRGPEHRFRCHGMHITVEIDIAKHIFGKDTTVAALSASARLATTKVLRASAAISPTALIEPVMNVVIQTDESSMGAVMHDVMSARSGQILAMDNDAASGALESGRQPIDLSKVYAPKDPFVTESKISSDAAGARQLNRLCSISAKIPLREMVGYLKHLRSLTAGRGTFVMSVDKFEKMNAAQVNAVLKELRGV